MNKQARQRKNKHDVYYEGQGNRWLEAVSDAEEELKKAKSEKEKAEKRIRQVRFALGVFKSNAKRGLPWPGEG